MIQGFRGLKPISLILSDYRCSRSSFINFTVGRLILIFFFCLFVGCLFAQDQVYLAHDTLKKVDINRVAFSATDTLTHPAQVLSGKQLLQAGQFSVADAVKLFSGVQVKDYGGIGGMKTLNVRSLTSNHTTLYYNGIAVNNSQNGQVDLGRYSLDNIRSVSLYNGQQSTLLLPAKAFASASALLLEAGIQPFDANQSTRIKASLRTGSFGLFNPSLRWQQKISPRIRLSLNAEHVKAHGRYDFYVRIAGRDSLINRQNSDISSLRVEALIEGTMADSSRWDLHIYNYSSDRGLPGAAIANRYYSQERQKDDEFFMQGNWEKELSTFYRLLVSSKYSRSKLDYLDPDFPNTAGFLNNRFQQQEAYLSLANLFVLSPRIKSSVSVDYSYSDLEANLAGFAYPERNTFLINAALEWRLGRLLLQTNALTTLSSERTELGRSSRDVQRVNPAISASWRPFSDHSLYIRSFYKSIFRLPTFNDSYYTLVGSTDLEPEQVKQFDVGFTWQKAFPGKFELFTLKADAYHNRVKDQITAIPGASLFRWTMVNLGQVDIKGIDFGVTGRVKASDEFYADIALNYTLQEARDDSRASANYGQYIPYAPVHSGSVSIDALWKNRWGLNYNSQYSGERYNARANIADNLMAPWAVHNISASYNSHTARFGYRVSAELNNFSNRNYTIVHNYPMPGSNYRLSLQITF